MAPDQWMHEYQARQRGYNRIAGIDEVGRGPLAGPVVAAAVILPEVMPDLGITDSKRLSAKKREAVYEAVYQHASAIGVGLVDAVEIDRINILQAAFIAMAMALYNLSPKPDFILVDGNQALPVDVPQETIIKGDQLSISIAAASIVAKVTRDRMMDVYDTDYPEYDFAANKGYPTQAHKSAIEAYGASPIHRMSFKGVAAFSSQ
ncbi:MAG: ribonuclease HII [Desulfobacterales bacterium]